MKTLTTLLAAATLTTLSFGAFANDYISATGSTLDSAESHIAAKAEALGASGYHITSARTHHGVYMTAKLDK